MMTECQSILAAYDGEQHVIAAARHIVKALGATKNLSEDLRKILLDLDSRLSSMGSITEDRGRGGLMHIEQRLKYAEETILNWEPNRSAMHDSGQSVAPEYLEVVNEVQALTKSLSKSSISGNRKHKELFGQADGLLQMAMSALGAEVVHILDQHKQFLEPQRVMSFSSCGEDVTFDESFVSVEDASIEEASRRNSCGNDSEVLFRDLINPGIISHLKSIAASMFASDYGQEFCHSFTCIRREALKEYLVILEMQNLSTEEVIKLDWDSLNNEIRKWVRAMKIIIRIYLASEKQLCNKILGDFGSVNQGCFVEISKMSILGLLNFGQAVAMGTLRPEKLVRLLDMYEVLAELLPNVSQLFLGDDGTLVRSEFQKLLGRIGEAAKATFLEFRYAIASNDSSTPFPRGGVHHLTRYVMNFLKILTIYEDNLNVLLQDVDAVDDSNLVAKQETDQDVPSPTFSPIARHLRSITATLESNLEKKSKLYKNVPLQHIFMMNNLHYMVHKVMGSELQVLFGDEWIRKHMGKYQQQATSYERATWSAVVSLLKDDGSSLFASRSLKEKCRGFTAAFDEVYKAQTRWSIPDPQLRDDLRIANSLKVIHAYQSFLGRNSYHLSDKHIKYTVTDLEDLLLHFFQEESPGLLRNSHRR